MRIRQLSVEAGGPEGTALLPPQLLSVRWVRDNFRRTDNGDGGRLGTLGRGLQFWWRCWWNAHALQVSTAAFRAGVLSPITRIRPEVALRPLRSYLRHGLDVERRGYAVHAHFAWLSRNLPQALIDQLYAGECVTLLGDDAPVPGVGVSLAAADDLGHEGELALHLHWHGTIVMSMAFSVLDASVVIGRRDPQHLMGPRIVIGALRGRRGAGPALHAMSQASQRLRPSALLVLAAQALTATWNLAPPLAVMGASHVSAKQALIRAERAMNYDAIWMELGGYPTGRHYWALPDAPDLRPEDEVESRRRSQHRRRNALRVALIAAIRARMATLLAPA